MTTKPGAQAPFSDIDLAIARSIRLEDVLAMHGITLKRQSVELVGPCPVCGGHDRFAVNIRKQVHHCRGCGARGGGAIDLEMHISGASFVEAARSLAGQSNVRPIRPQPAPAQHAENDNYALELAERVWRTSKPLPLSAFILNFCDRAIRLDKVPDRGGLRFHPKCPWGNGTEECVIGRFTTVIGNEPRGIWRRPLDGSKPKTLGPMAGCVIRLWPDDYVTTGLVIGEGVETTLAAALNIEHEGTMLQPAWATGSAGNLAKFPALPGIEHLTILVDNDESGTGQRAADECKHRWIEAGLEVELLIPDTVGEDFNDVVMKEAA